MSDSLSRRSFLGRAALAGLGATLVPRHVLGGAGYQAPSDTIGIAGVGVGGVGHNKIRAMDSEQIVALCDIDLHHARGAFGDYPDATVYQDYRRMLDEMDDAIDAVVIATPDHTHAVIAQEAMQRGKHVYVEKPLTWSIDEAHTLTQIADETGVVAAMGNQGHSLNDARLVNEYLQDGAIGTVREVHAWTNRPIWPQGMAQPEVLKRKPQHIDWDLFLGPAPEIPYDPAYHPFAWRGWFDFGTGALGDMGAHLIDHPVWALDLGYPDTIETRSTTFNGVSWPHASMTYFTFPARGDQPPVKLTWYDGGLQPPRPKELPEDESLNALGGVIYTGDEGTLMHETYGANPRLLPDERMAEYGTPPERYRRIQDESHEMNWVRAIKGEEELSQDFGYAARLTQIMLLGVVSMRAGNRRIHWDAEARRVTNLPEANAFLARQEVRDGWTL
ncbi:MAG: Gfo/Idh/MocA family oxidoreductase [Bacteroidetes bacterium]|jgi:predicted dehydrogenase|nr:Gfo/Idh/MocA family oxidoreductase [Bacteroidota bacterium]